MLIFIILSQSTESNYFPWRSEHDVTFHFQTLIGCPYLSWCQALSSTSCEVPKILLDCSLYALFTVYFDPVRPKKLILNYNCDHSGAIQWWLMRSTQKLNVTSRLDSKLKKKIWFDILFERIIKSYFFAIPSYNNWIKQFWSCTKIHQNNKHKTTKHRQLSLIGI